MSQSNSGTGRRRGKVKRICVTEEINQKYWEQMEKLFEFNLHHNDLATTAWLFVGGIKNAFKSHQNAFKNLFRHT